MENHPISIFQYPFANWNFRQNAQKCSGATTQVEKLILELWWIHLQAFGLKVGTADATGSEVCVPVTVTGF